MHLLITAVLLLQPSEMAFFDTDFEALAAQANEAYQQGDYAASAEFYLQFLQHNARDVTALYNLACCYGLLGEAELARDFARRSLRAGFSDLEWMMWDPDFDGVRESEVFSAFSDSLAAAAEQAAMDEDERISVEARVILPCILKFPEDYDPYQPAVLLIGLHGYGASPEGFAGLWDAFEEPNFIYAVPQAPYNRFSGAEPGYSWMIWSPNENLSASTAMASYDYICETARVMQEYYDISETYLMGFSQGCGFALETGLMYPEYFDGIIGFGGWLDPEIVTPDHLEAASDLRVFIAHGTEDTAVEFQGGEDAFYYLEDNGFDVVFHPFEGGHTVDRETLRMAQEWMER